MRAPTKEQKAQEAALLYTGLGDFAVLLLQIAFAIATLSLTLISEVLRAGLLLIMDFYVFLILRAVHRDRLGRFRFGIGKLEQACNFAVGVAIVFGGFWVADRVFDTLLFGGPRATPLGLALAAVVSAINTLINFLGWVAVSAAARPGDSAIYQAQARSRMVSLVASLIVQITLTIAVLVKDPVISLWLDGLGASFVACFMISIGLRMIADCAPHLLDHSAPQEVKQRIAGTLHSEMVPPEGLLRTRTRQAGRHPQAELTLDLTGCTSLAVLNRRVDVIQRQLNSCIRDVEVSIVVDEPPGVRS